MVALLVLRDKFTFNDYVVASVAGIFQLAVRDGIAGVALSIHFAAQTVVHLIISYFVLN